MVRAVVRSGPRRPDGKVLIELEGTGIIGQLVTSEELSGSGSSGGTTDGSQAAAATSKGRFTRFGTELQVSSLYRLFASKVHVYTNTHNVAQVCGACRGGNILYIPWCMCACCHQRCCCAVCAAKFECVTVTICK